MTLDEAIERLQPGVRNALADRLERVLWRLCAPLYRLSEQLRCCRDCGAEATCDICGRCYPCCDAERVRRGE